MSTRWSDPQVEYARPPFRHREIGPGSVLVWFMLAAVLWALIALALDVAGVL